MKPCYRCATYIADNAITCVSCGAIQPLTPPTPVAPPAAPPSIETVIGKQPMISLLAGIYLALAALASLAYFALVYIFNLPFTIERVLLIGLPNLLNTGAAAFLVVCLFKRKRNAPLFFTIWGGIFLLAQTINRQMVWNGWHIFPTLGFLRLWVIANLVLIVALAIFLWKKKAAFNK